MPHGCPCRFLKFSGRSSGDCGVAAEPWSHGATRSGRRPPPGIATPIRMERLFLPVRSDLVQTN